MWGKERGLSGPYPVICHLLDTAAVFGALWDGLLGESMRERIAGALGLGVADCRGVLAFWAGLHDLGKVTPPFQAQVPPLYAELERDPLYRSAPGAERERGLRHETATHWALAKLLADAGYPQGRRRPGGQLMKTAVSHQVAQLLGGHHGVYGPVLGEHQVLQAEQYQPGLGGDGWAEQRRVHFEELRRVAGGGAVPWGGLPAELAVVVTGLVVTADWLASQTEVVEGMLPGSSWQGAPGELDAHWERSREVAGRLVAGTRLGRAVFGARGFGEMFPFTPNALQADVAGVLPGLVESDGSGLVLVTAPTGDGKTEAALYAASVLGRAAGARGLYFALPTMATADAMFPRVAAFAEAALGGERALTLLHSMAWLSPVYDRAGGPGVAGSGGVGELSASVATATWAGEWLRGAKRGLLAPLSVGTVDQALSAVLPVRYNALRYFGLSEKVFVLDEAHAYGPWMQYLLVQLLEWLGALRVPVVLLSATLTGRSAGALVNAYRRGAGFGDVEVVPRYPGWLYASAVTGEVSAPRVTASDRRRTLEVAVRRVVWGDERSGAGSGEGEGLSRREVLVEELRGVVEGGGTVLVCCTTVAEAQRTFRELGAEFPELAARVGGLRLLHSRFPAGVRQRISTECEAAYGKPTAGGAVGVRAGSVLVATQVVEQSLDLDFDLVISDLAPLAQLLQRAGRCRRHRRGVGGRPGWAGDESRPRLVVLDPFVEGVAGEKPRRWGPVYDAGLLLRTSLLLGGLGRGEIRVPEDVQGLIDVVYGPAFGDDLEESARRELRALDAEREAEEMAEEQLAAMVGVGGPVDVGADLHRLSDRMDGVSEELLTTRLGADTGRLLCLYVQQDGRRTLDGQGGVSVPGLGGGGLSREDVRLLLSRVAPVPGKWLRGGDEALPQPVGWEKQPLLREVVVLALRRDAEGVWSAQYGDRTIAASEETGIEII